MQQQQNILIVVYIIESPCYFVRVVCFCIVTIITTWEVTGNLIHGSMETEVHNNTMGPT